MLDRLVESLETCPMVKRGEYNYFIHPITDGVPLVEPALLRDVCSAMIKVLDLNNVDKIVVVEAMGIHIGAVLSVMTDIPMTVMRKREYKLPREVPVHQTTGYSKGELYLNGVYKGDRVVIIDDVVSTGGTMKALLDSAGNCRGRGRGCLHRDPAGRPRTSAGRTSRSCRIEVTDKVHVVERYL